jgi:hypothetical protein
VVVVGGLVVVSGFETAVEVDAWAAVVELFAVAFPGFVTPFVAVQAVAPRASTAASAIPAVLNPFM